MSTLTLERNATITRRSGRAVRVSMPYAAYKKMRDAYISIQIYNDSKTQKNLKRAKEDVKARRVKTFSNVDDLIRSLDEE